MTLFRLKLFVKIMQKERETIDAARAKNTNHETKCQSNSFNYTVVAKQPLTWLGSHSTMSLRMVIVKKHRRRSFVLSRRRSHEMTNLPDLRRVSRPRYITFSSARWKSSETDCARTNLVRRLLIHFPSRRTHCLRIGGINIVLYRYI